MKIVTPLTDIDGYARLVEAGAGEFFCGFIPYEWLKKNNNTIPLNRRENLLNCNISTLSSMKILRKRIEKYGAEVKITLNSLYYHEEDYEIILHTIKNLMDLGYNTFIIADLALIIYLREQGIKCNIHLSGENSEVNHWTINFLNNYGISRYIFTRKNTFSQMKSCIDNCNKQGIEFEAFILNELCSYSGAFCNSIHSEELRHMCHNLYLRRTVSEKPDKFRIENRVLDILNKTEAQLYSADSTDDAPKAAGDGYVLAQSGCGICRIKKLMDIGVTHLKLVGRGKLLEHLIKDVEALRDIIRLAGEGKSEEQFEKTVKEKYFGGKCSVACYYPKEKEALRMERK